MSIDVINKTMSLIENAVLPVMAPGKHVSGMISHTGCHYELTFPHGDRSYTITITDAGANSTSVPKAASADER